MLAFVSAPPYVGVTMSRTASAQGRRGPGGLAAGLAIGTPDGTLLHVRDYGPADAPATVVLAHGWTMSSTFWTATAEALARKGLHVVTYDQRGHGRSSLPGPQGYDLSHLGRDLANVMDIAVPTDRPVVLAGHSMGAMTVLAWAEHVEALRHDVRGAVLTNTSAHEVVPDALAAMTGTTGGVAHGLLRQLVRAPIPVPRTPINRAVVRRVALGTDAPRSAVDLTHKLFLDCSPVVRVGFAHKIDDLDLREGASRLLVPTVVVAGTEDKLTPPSHAQELVGMLPEASLRVMPGAGHQAPLERPAETVELIARHVSALTVTRPRDRSS